jgi:hypothetical protein
MSGQSLATKEPTPVHAANVVRMVTV